VVKKKNIVFSTGEKHPSGNVSDYHSLPMFKFFKKEHDKEGHAEEGNRYQDISRCTTHNLFF